MTPYNPRKIEKKWQKVWEKEGAFRFNEKSKKAKFYALSMFPYPSGEGLHVGHPESYTAIDIVSRYLRMRDYNVLNPMGWDAFGLPAENFAIKTGVHPAKTTKKSINRFREQIKSLGFSYDWSREVNTSDPEYYKWTQWLFLYLYKKGLAYQKEAPVNWCPGCQTVLANEQVVAGECERCHSKVVQKNLKQWFFKITDYVERLLKDLESVDWPEKIKAMQRNWIGKSEGAVIEFKLKTESQKLKAGVKVFTTRPDTLFGATYLVLAPEHPILKNQELRIKNQGKLDKYIKEASDKTELERLAEAKTKTGVQLKGIKAINPATKEEIPVFVADYVLYSYGTGAVMGVPAHDERDFEFAKKFKLPIRQVIAPHVIDHNNPPRKGKINAPRTVVQGVVKHWSKNEIIQLVWKDFPWKTFVIGGAEDGEGLEEALRREIKEETGYTNIKTISRLTPEIRSEWYADHKKENRYAYMNIFLVELAGPEKEEMAEEEKKKHEVKWVPIKEASSFSPVGEIDFIVAGLKGRQEVYKREGILINSGKFSEIPSKKSWEKIVKFVKGKKNTTYKLRDWLVSRQRYWGAPIPIIYCQKCGTVPVPEKDLPVKLPTDVDFKPTGRSPLERSKSFHKVKCPKCKFTARREIDTMDTFVDSSWYYLRYIDPHNKTKPFNPEKAKKIMPVDLYIGGAEHAVLHLLYSRFINKALADNGLVTYLEPFLKLRNQGLILAPDGRKMSKSLGNVINPDDIVEQYGADTLRMYEMFMGPLEDEKPWGTKGIMGIFRFLTRVWKLSEELSKQKDARKKIEESGELRRAIHKTIDKVERDITEFKFNTAISALMVLLSKIEKEKSRPAFGQFLLLLYPFAPHISSEVWEKLNFKKRVWEHSWPEVIRKYLYEEEIKLIVQVNGRVRDVIDLPGGLKNSELVEAATGSVNVARNLKGKKIKDTIIVPDKLVNFVTE